MSNGNDLKKSSEFVFPNVDSYFRQLAESLSYFVLLVDPETLKIQYINHVNPTTKIENVIGNTIFHFVWPEYAELLYAKIETVRKSKVPETIEILGTTSANSENKAWYRSTISIILDENKLIKHFILTVEEISEAKRNEIETINKSEKIKAIINNTRDIICSIDTEYRLTEFNAVFADVINKGFGIILEPGMFILDFIDPTKHQHLINIYEKVKLGETFYDIESFKGSGGSVVYNETSYHPIYNADKQITGISIFSKDITDRIKNEQKIKTALKEKEILLLEIHHRIKNNLAMVSSLLQLQEFNIENAEAKEALYLSRKRIKSTALIHELLYKNESFEKIILHEYLKEIFQYLNNNPDLRLNLNGDEVSLNLTTAMPLGLMLNELLLNSFKHCYNSKSSGEITISFLKDPAKLTVIYSDFAGEFPSTIDFYNANTTGLTLIHTFAEQLNGKVELTLYKPAQYKIILPINEND